MDLKSKNEIFLSVRINEFGFLDLAAFNLVDYLEGTGSLAGREIKKQNLVCRFIGG